MQFIYFDAQASLHSISISRSEHTIADIDVHWLDIGHESFPGRLHAMACFEKTLERVPEDHQFTFRSWYDMPQRVTHCMWYSVPKMVLNSLPHHPIQTKSLLFMLPRFFSSAIRKKSVLVFVNLLGCEMVAGYVRGICVCFKKLPSKHVFDAQHEWAHVQQAYPQWMFDHSLVITAQPDDHLGLIQTHQHTVCLKASPQVLDNRMKLYGLA